jgi:hypothetical protein
MTITSRLSITLILALFGLWMGACVDEVELPARSITSRLVVEGLITNEAPPYAIKLTFTGAYNSLIYGQAEIPVNGAVVNIREAGGKTISLEQDALSPAYYWTKDSTFVGRIGSRYQIKVTLPDGTSYISDPEELRGVPPIDKIYAEYRPRAEAEISQPDQYEILLDTKDPATAGDYYRWSGYSYVPRLSTGEPIGFGICCNWCWVPIYGSRSEVMSDMLVNGNTISRKTIMQSPVYYAGRHYVEVRQYSLTKSAYQFWVKFEEQRKRTGSLFDPLPAPIEGNVHRLDKPDAFALGYFGASAVSTRRLTVPGDTLNPERLKIRYGDTFVQKGNCQLVYSQGQLNPPSW